VRCTALNTFLVKPFSFSIAYVDANIAGKEVGENNLKLFSGHCLGDDDSMHLTVISIVDTTIWSIVNRALANLPDPFQIIGELWGCQEELIGYGGPHTHNVTPIFIYNTGARCGRPVMKLHIPTRYTIVYNGQQAGSTSGALMPIHAGHSYQSPDVILLPAAEDIINDIRAESNDAERWHPN